MARQTIERMIDDVDGSDATRTITFRWSGRDYQIDLSAKNARAFEAAISPYIQVATRVGGGRTNRRTSAPAPRAGVAEVRVWAVSNGYKLGDRGRIPQAIVEAYESAQGSTSRNGAGSGRAQGRNARAKKVPARRAPARKTSGRRAAK